MIQIISYFCMPLRLEERKVHRKIYLGQILHYRQSNPWSTCTKYPLWHVVVSYWITTLLSSRSSNWNAKIYHNHLFIVLTVDTGNLANIVLKDILNQNTLKQNLHQTVTFIDKHWMLKWVYVHLGFVSIVYTIKTSVKITA